MIENQYINEAAKKVLNAIVALNDSNMINIAFAVDKNIETQNTNYNMDCILFLKMVDAVFNTNIVDMITNTNIANEAESDDQLIYITLNSSLVGKWRNFLINMGDVAMKSIAENQLFDNYEDAIDATTDDELLKVLLQSLPKSFYSRCSKFSIGEIVQCDLDSIDNKALNSLMNEISSMRLDKRNISLRCTGGNSINAYIYNISDKMYKIYCNSDNNIVNVYVVFYYIDISASDENQLSFKVTHLIINNLSETINSRIISPDLYVNKKLYEKVCSMLSKGNPLYNAIICAMLFDIPTTKTNYVQLQFKKSAFYLPNDDIITSNTDIFTGITYTELHYYCGYHTYYDELTNTLTVVLPDEF